jgi:endonuclease/exonuclease/phosphatase family metal-dependent hydrolase
MARFQYLEPRGALWVSIDLGETKLQVINTHLGLLGRERLAQVKALLGPDWLGHPDCRDPVILAGDFNATPQSRAYRRLTSRLSDAQRSPSVARARATFPVRLPVFRIDHVFVSDAVEVLGAEVPRTPLACVASDHLPLVVDFQIVPEKTLSEPVPAKGMVTA